MFVEKGQRGVTIGKRTKIKIFYFFYKYFVLAVYTPTLAYRLYRLNIVGGQNAYNIVLTQHLSVERSVLFDRSRRKKRKYINKDKCRCSKV